MIKHNFTIKEIFKSAWNAAKNNVWFLFVVSFISVALMAATQRSGGFGIIISTVIGIALLTVSLVIANGKTPEYSDLTKSFKNYKIIWHYVLASILYGIIVCSLFIIPLIGIMYIFASTFMSLDFMSSYLILGVCTIIALFGFYIMTRLQFYKFIVIEHENIGAIKSLKESMKITEGNFWNIFGFMIAIVLFNLVGVMLFVIGLVVTIPVSVLAVAFLYKKLSHREHAHSA